MFSLLVLIEKTKSSYFIEEYFIPGIFIIFNEPNVMITLYKPRDTDINNILNLLTTLVVLFSGSVFKTFSVVLRMLFNHSYCNVVHSVPIKKYPSVM